MHEYLSKFLIYAAFNLVAAIIYFFYLPCKKACFNVRFSQHKKSTEIPSIIYYSGVLIKFILKFVLSIVFFPVLLFVDKQIKAGAQRHTEECFKQHTPYVYDNYTRLAIASTSPDKIKKIRFRCPFWDAYNAGDCYTSYDCIHHCPLYFDGYQYFLFSDEEEAKYNESIRDEYNLVDLREHVYY